MKRYVVGIFVNGATGDVALVRKDRPEKWKGRVTGPGGKIEAGETIHEAMVREFREETGVVTSKDDWTHTVILHTGEFELHFLRCYGDPFLCRQIESEEIFVGNIHELPPTMFGNAHWAIPLSLDKRLVFPVRMSYYLGCEGRAPLGLLDVPGAVTAPSTPEGELAASGTGVREF